MTAESKWLLRRAGAGARAAAIGALPPARTRRHYPSQDIRLICAFPRRQRRRRAGALLRREAAADRQPHRDRREQGRRRRQHRDRICRARQARRLHHLRPRRRPRSRPTMHLFKKPPVDAGKTIQVAATINRQPFMLVVDAKSPYKTVADLTAAMKKKGDKASYATAAPTGTHHGRDLQERDRHQGGRGELQDRAGFAQRDARAARSTTACTIRCSRSRSSARGGCASSRSAPASGSRRSPDMPTMTEARRSDGSHRLVGGHGAGRHAEAGRRPDQQVVRADRVDGRDQEVPQQLRRRSVHQHARAGAGAVPEATSRTGATTSGSRRSSRR